MPTDRGHVRRGRRSNPVIGFGPVADQARTFRSVLFGDRSRTLRMVAEAANCGTTSVSDACSGKKLPSEETARACLKAVGIVDQADVDEWLDQLRAAAKMAELFRAPAAAKIDVIVRELCGLLDRLGLDVADLEGRIAEHLDFVDAADNPGKIRELAQLPEAVPDRRDLAMALTGRAPLGAGTLDWIMFAAGGTPDDRSQWKNQLEKVEDLSRLASGRARTGEPPAPDAVAPAAHEPAPGGRDRRSLLLLLSGISIVILGVLGYQAFLRHTDRVAPPGSSSRSESPTAEPTAPSTRDVLGELAGRVCDLPDQTAPLSYIYVRRLSWSVETAGAIGDRATVDERTWWNPADHSGVRRTQQSGQQSQVEHFGPGQFLPSLAGKFSSDPATLVDQLTVNHPARVGPARVIRGAQEFFDSYVPSAGQRCVFLRGIADAPGLVYRDQALDQRGRPGIAVSGDDARGLAREEMIVDPEDGEVLGFNSYDLSGMLPTMTGSVTYVDRGYASHPE